MHFRPPSIAPGIIALVWAVALGAYVYFGLLAVGASGAFAIVISMVAAAGDLAVRRRARQYGVAALRGRPLHARACAERGDEEAGQLDPDLPLESLPGRVRDPGPGLRDEWPEDRAPPLAATCLLRAPSSSSYRRPRARTAIPDGRDWGRRAPATPSQRFSPSAKA